MNPPEDAQPSAEPTAEATVRVESTEAMRRLGAGLADLLRPGDLVVLAGPLGAGKTTLTQGVGAGLGVAGRVVSPTFVIARVHRGGRVPLVHADAYRIGSVAEIDDLDLDASLAESVTVVEWGEGLVENLAEDRLEVHIERGAGADGAAGPSPDDAADEPRVVRIQGYGDRWAGVSLDPSGPGGGSAASPS